jgi:hypothetical protein
VVKELPLGVEGVLDGSLPKGIAATFFGRHPLWGPAILLTLALGGALLSLRGK